MTKYRVFLLTNILFSLLKMVLPAIGISSKIHSKKLLPKFLDNIYQVVERNQVQTKYILNYFQILSSILSNRYYYSSYFFFFIVSVQPRVQQQNDRLKKEKLIARICITSLDYRVINYFFDILKNTFLTLF